MYETLEASKYFVYLATKQCYYGICRYKESSKSIGIRHIPYAGLFLSKMKFPKYLFDDFLKCTLQEEFNNKTCEYVNKFYHDIRKCSDKKNITDYGIYTYGLDEIFDAYLLKYLVENKIPYLIDIAPDLFAPFEKIEEIFKQDPEKLNSTLYKELLSKLMGKFYDPNKLTADNLTQLYRSVAVFLVNRQKNHRYIYTAKRLFFTYLDFLKTGEYQKYGFDVEHLYCIKHHYNIIEIATILCTGTKCIDYQKLIKNEK